MPIYVMQCPCGHTEEIYRTIKDMDLDLPKHCGAKMTRKITGAMVAADIQPYQRSFTCVSQPGLGRLRQRSRGLVLGQEERYIDPAPVALGVKVGSGQCLQRGIASFITRPGPRALPDNPFCHAQSPL